MIRNESFIRCGGREAWRRQVGKGQLGSGAGRFGHADSQRSPARPQERDHVPRGRPGHELIYNQRVLHAWGIDGHNSHTNVCSAGARTGYALWHGFDRPSPDYANARFILLLSSHFEAGHYFNPHAQRIMDGKAAGAKVCVQLFIILIIL